MLKKGDQVSVYKIKKVLGEEETHLCYFTEDPFFHCPILLKVYPLDFQPEGQSHKDLEESLEKLFLLEHPSIAPILDSGFEEDFFFYTTNLHHQSSLVERAIAGISAKDVLTVICDLGLALAYATDRGAVHGALSTEKIYYGENGQLVIADFGVEACLSAFKNGELVDWPEKRALEDLGQLQLQLLRPSNMDNRGREAEIIAGIENEELKNLTGRFFASGEQGYQSFSELLEALDPLLDSPPVETRPVCQAKALENPDDKGITLQQRELVLPHVRQLVAEKNTYKTLLDEVLLQQSKIADELQRARHDLEQAGTLQLEAPPTVTADFKKRAAVWLLGGFALGLALSGSFGFSWQQKNLAVVPVVEEQVKTMVAAEEKPPGEVAKKEIADKIIVAQPVKGQDPAEKIVTVPMPKEKPQLLVKQKPIPVIVEEPQQWWPAGQEFSSKNPVAIDSVSKPAVANVLSPTEKDTIINDLMVWANSWSAQNLDRYFSCYSDKYRPPRGRNRAEWLKNRRSRLLHPDWIRIELQDIKMRLVDNKRVQVKFQQKYSSNTYQDLIWKSINLVRESDNWKIITEHSLGRVDLVASR